MSTGVTAAEERAADLSKNAPGGAAADSKAKSDIARHTDPSGYGKLQNESIQAVRAEAAGATGGGRDGRARQSRIFRIASEEWIAFHTPQAARTFQDIHGPYALHEFSPHIVPAMLANRDLHVHVSIPSAKDSLEPTATSSPKAGIVILPGKRNGD